MITKAPRGTKDILPSETFKWQYIEEEARKICREFGFGEIRTPIFEHTELFLRGVGETTDIVQKEMYTFDDRGGRSITLKPEGTAPAVRSYIEHSLYGDGQINKLYYITPVFRYERPQAGRLREFHQFGIEMFGSKQASADAEVISLAMMFLQRMGIENLKVNINSLGCPKCKEEYNNRLKEYFSRHMDSLCETCVSRYDRNPLRILDCKSEKCKEIAKGAPIIIDSLCDECEEHFENLKKELNNLNIPYLVDPYIVRGLDYYTKTVFEIISGDIGAQSTVCGGGRYDNLIAECGGPSIPAVGFGFGIERLLMTMENNKSDIIESSRPLLFIAAIGDKAENETSKLIMELRKNHISCERDLMGKNIKGQMKYANKINAKYAIVIGENEILSNKVKLKNMETGVEEEIELKNIKDEIIKR